MLQDAGYLLPTGAKHLAGMTDDRLTYGVDEIFQQTGPNVTVEHEIDDGILRRPGA
jgi:hypothetical protein